MPDLSILRVATKILMPFLFLFGFYVLFGGESSPGGGFQAGVVFAAAIILHRLVFGSGGRINILDSPKLLLLAAAGVAVYLGVGIAGMSGGNFLNYSVLHETPQNGQAIAIMLVESGVAITVAAAMIGIFLHLAEKGK